MALTLDPARRSVRALAAAWARHEAGGHDAALELLQIAEAGPLSDLDAAKAERLRALVIYARTDGRAGAAEFLRAARRLDPLDAALARATYVDALGAVLKNVDTAHEVCGALVALPMSEPPDPAQLLVRGWSLLFTEGFPHGTNLLRRAVAAFVAEPSGEAASVRALSVALAATISTWDDAGFDVLSQRVLKLARDQGMLSELPHLLEIRAALCGYLGDLADGAAAVDEAAAIRAATGVAPAPGEFGIIAALREREDAAAAEIERLHAAFANRDAIDASAMADSLAVLYNGLGRHRDALAAARRSSELHPRGGSGLGLDELVEAAARCHEMDVGLKALETMRVRTQRGGTDWALGVEARCRALLTSGPAAEELYREAIERLGLTRMRLPLARAHLVYGEWLRRERRRGEARSQLRFAHDMFEAMGARSFAGRARQELAATGITAQSRRNPKLDELTPREARVAIMASEGLTNADIAARLYISVGTVEYHLHAVYRKLSIRSRTQLHLSLAPVAGRS